MLQVHRCRFGAAPIDAILEVREAVDPDTDAGAAVTHETVSIVSLTRHADHAMLTMTLNSSRV